MSTYGEATGNKWETFNQLIFPYCNYFQKEIRTGLKPSHKFLKVEYNWSMHGEPLRQ